jgi:leucyl-tRNA synthetase
MAEDGTKMSKSKGNVVNPDEIVRESGADTLRVYEMFIGPFAEPAPWSVSGVSGVKRFLDRVMRLPTLVATEESKDVTRGLHKMLKHVTEDYDRMSFNTAIAQYMTFVNTVYAAGAFTAESLKIFLRALSVAAPHVCEELWAQLGGDGLICQQPWPAYNETLVHAATYELVVQVNGKVRDRIAVAMNASEDEVRAIALQSEKVQEWLAGKTPAKIVVIKNKLVSIAV